MIPIAIRELGDLDDDWEHPCLSEDGKLVLGRGETLVGEMGAKSIHLDAVALRSDRREQLLRLEESAIEVSVTDQRVVYLCRKYDVGGGWAGVGAGMAVAAVANKVSQRRAASRSHGTVLLGQVRYPWVMMVGGSAKRGWIESDSILIACPQTASEGGTILQVRLDLFPGPQPNEVARDIAARAARYRLAHEALEDRHKKTLEQVTQAGVLRNEKRKYAFHSLPTAFLAGAGREKYTKSEGQE